MHIGGIQRFSSIDFPGNLAAVIFTVGCNFRCPFCHNPKLVCGNVDPIAEAYVLEFLTTRTRQLEGVVISGGEPTLQQDLFQFIEKVRTLGFSIKLDTNGTHPETLETLLAYQMLDYVAVDIKHVMSRYAFAAGVASPMIEKIQNTIDLLLNSPVAHEFRTTVIRDFHTLEDVVAISKQIRGAQRYVLQEFIPKTTLDAKFAEKLPFEKSLLETIIPEVKKNVQQFEIRQ
ncbi:MAG: anaerobic ribonucleoside-triphosphate reductase activating protein [Puniceicoccales bacterium]|jgi:pyruvate formate lyase activating enzyme|nr:anaerobic ribonucleoside-triphosphate reductase activating protein [Puniceicoccales bacterium]